VSDLGDTLRDLVRAEVRAELAAQRATPVAPRLLSVADAAAALGLSRASLYKELSAGRLRSVHISRRRLVPESALAEYIEGLPMT
jgi:excisionase family DNA binding protein